MTARASNYFLHRASLSVLLLFVCMLLSACIGEIGDGPREIPIAETVELATNRFPRLSHSQWEQTIVDLFAFDAPTGLSASFASDPLGGKVFDNDQSALEVTPLLWRDYQVAAEAIAEKVTGDATLLAHVAPQIRRKDLRPNGRAFLESFGRRAFRRPLSSEEIDSRLALFREGAALHPELDPFVAGVRVSIAAFLQSPYFIYRVEGGLELVDGKPAPVDGWVTASRLSYALWNSMPDEELFRAAQAGELATPLGIHQQVERMIDTPRSHDVVKRFFDQLYDGSQYEGLTKDPTLYPEFTAKVASDMRTELGMFTENVYSTGGGVRELLTSTTTFVTPRLAAIYGIAVGAGSIAADGDAFSRVELDPKRRSGLLTRSGFLAWKGTATDPKTIQRGVFVTRRIVCQPLGDPPPKASGKTIGGQPTDRERVDALTGPGTCGASCHGNYMNPAGFAFEHYGATGEYRSRDGDAPIDSSAVFPLDEGPLAYGDAIGLSRGLAESPQVHACFTKYLLQYLTGRERVTSDESVLGDLAQSSLSGASARDLLVSALESDAMRYPLTITEAP